MDIDMDEGTDRGSKVGSNHMWCPLCQDVGCIDEVMENIIKSVAGVWAPMG